MISLNQSSLCASVARTRNERKKVRKTAKLQSFAGHQFFGVDSDAPYLLGTPTGSQLSSSTYYSSSRRTFRSGNSPITFWRWRKQPALKATPLLSVRGLNMVKYLMNSLLYVNAGTYHQVCCFTRWRYEGGWSLGIIFNSISQGIQLFFPEWIYSIRSCTGGVHRRVWWSRTVQFEN